MNLKDFKACSEIGRSACSYSRCSNLDNCPSEAVQKKVSYNHANNSSIQSLELPRPSDCFSDLGVDERKLNIAVLLPLPPMKRFSDDQESFCS